MSITHRFDLEGAERAAALFGWESIELRPIALGRINETYVITAVRDRFVLQRLNLDVLADPDAVTSNIVKVQRHVGAKLCPEPVAAPEGTWLVRDGASCWRAFRHVPGGAPLHAVTPEGVAEAGAILARFHAALADFDPSLLAVTLPRFHDLRARLGKLRRNVETDPYRRASSVGAELAACDEAATLVDVAEELGLRVPVRAAHFDAKLDNVLFCDRRAVALVDLDTVMPGAWFWDVGDLLRTAGTTADEDDPHPGHAAVAPGLYEAVLGAYRETMPDGLLTPDEMAALEVAGSIVTFEQGVRFLTDFLAGDRYYRTDRPDQNLDRARLQLRLLETMPDRVHR